MMECRGRRPRRPVTRCDLSDSFHIIDGAGVCRRRYFLVPPRKYPKNAAGEAVECLAPARQATSPDPTRRALSLVRLTLSTDYEVRAP